MKFVRVLNMLVAYVAISLAVVFTNVANAATVDIRFDVSAAKATLTALDNPKLTLAEATDVARIHGNKSLIVQARRFDPQATEQNFILTLMSLAKRETPTLDPFQLTLNAEQKNQAAALVRQIDTNPRLYIKPAETAIARYSPQGVTLVADAVIVLGGTSDGWSPGVKRAGRDQFYIASDYFKGDANGLSALLAHELFHVVQSNVNKANTNILSSSSDAIILTLCQNLLDEGTASLVGDMLNWPGEGAYLKKNREKYTRNLQRLPEIANLFSSLIYRAAYDPKATIDDLYPLAFTGSWDSSVYYLGYYMAKTIEQKAGRPALIAALSASPAEFVIRYNRIASSTDPKFTTGTIAIVEQAAVHNAQATTRQQK